MKKYKVVDNFLEEKHFIQLKDIMEGRIGKNINWFIHQGVSSDNTNDGYYFTHLFYGKT